MLGHEQRHLVQWPTDNLHIRLQPKHRSPNYRPFQNILIPYPQVSHHDHGLELWNPSFNQCLPSAKRREQIRTQHYLDDQHHNRLHLRRRQVRSI